jgi:hypothetical protein
LELLERDMRWSSARSQDLHVHIQDEYSTVINNRLCWTGKTEIEKTQQYSKTLFKLTK